MEKQSFRVYRSEPAESGYVFAFITLALASLIGCAGPGQLSVSKSTFDQSTQIRVEPAWVYNGWATEGMKLGIYRNSNMKPDEAIMVAVATDSHSIGDGESLQFNLNGTITNLVSMDATTVIESSPNSSRLWSSKRYQVTIPFLRSLADATNAAVRLNLDRSYFEGKISVDAPTTFRPALKRFLKAIEGGKSSP